MTYKRGSILVPISRELMADAVDIYPADILDQIAYPRVAIEYVEIDGALAVRQWVPPETPMTFCDCEYCEGHVE